MKLMSIAMKPVAFPPFPLERIEELTALMGGDGDSEINRKPPEIFSGGFSVLNSETVQYKEALSV